MRFEKSSGGYYYKINSKGVKTRISKKDYLYKVGGVHMRTKKANSTNYIHNVNNPLYQFQKDAIAAAKTHFRKTNDNKIFYYKKGFKKYGFIPLDKHLTKFVIISKGNKYAFISDKPHPYKGFSVVGGYKYLEQPQINFNQTIQLKKLNENSSLYEMRDVRKIYSNSNNNNTMYIGKLYQVKDLIGNNRNNIMYEDFGLVDSSDYSNCDYVVSLAHQYKIQQIGMIGKFSRNNMSGKPLSECIKKAQAK